MAFQALSGVLVTRFVLSAMLVGDAAAPSRWAALALIPTNNPSAEMWSKANPRVWVSCAAERLVASGTRHQLWWRVGRLLFCRRWAGADAVLGHFFRVHLGARGHAAQVCPCQCEGRFDGWKGGLPSPMHVVMELLRACLGVLRLLKDDGVMFFDAVQRESALILRCGAVQTLGACARCRGWGGGVVWAPPFRGFCILGDDGNLPQSGWAATPQISVIASVVALTANSCFVLIVVGFCRELRPPPDHHHATGAGSCGEGNIRCHLRHPGGTGRCVAFVSFEEVPAVFPQPCPYRAC